MSEIIFCPSCGASAEGARTYCPCCGASLRGDRPFNTMHSPVYPDMNQQPDHQDTCNTPQNQFPGQPFYQQGYGYGYGMYGQMPQKQDNGSAGCAVTGLVFGILSIILCCLSYIGILIGVVGIVLSCIGLRGTRCRGCAVAGLVCGITGTIMALVETIIILVG